MYVPAVPRGYLHRPYYFLNPGPRPPKGRVGKAIYI